MAQNEVQGQEQGPGQDESEELKTLHFRLQEVLTIMEQVAGTVHGTALLLMSHTGNMPQSAQPPFMVVVSILKSIGMQLESAVYHQRPLAPRPGDGD